MDNFRQTNTVIKLYINTVHMLAAVRKAKKMVTCYFNKLLFYIYEL